MTESFLNCRDSGSPNDISKYNNPPPYFSIPKLTISLSDGTQSLKIKIDKSEESTKITNDLRHMKFDATFPLKKEKGNPLEIIDLFENLPSDEEFAKEIDNAIETTRKGLELDQWSA